MKVLLLLFLVGYAAASIGDGLDRTAEAAVRELLGDTTTIIQRAEGDDDDVKTELGKKLRETLDHILEKIKESIESGKTVREDVLSKLKEVREKLKELKIDVGEKAKELFQKIKEKAKDFLQKILDRLGLKDNKDAEDKAVVFMLSIERMIQNAEDEDDIQTELGKKLREHLDEILEKIRDAIEKGKTVKQDVIDKLKELREKMKEHKIKIGEKARELIEQLKDKAKDFWKNLLDKLGWKDDKDTEVSRAESKIRDFFRKLKKSLLDTIDKEKLKEKIESFFGKNTEMAKNLIELLEKGKKKVIDWVDRVLGEDEEKESW